MAPEIWAAAAAAAAAVAAASSGLALAGRSGPWRLVAMGARLGSIAALAAALLLTARICGRWSPFDLRQVALGLALATAAIHLVLAWIPGMAGGSPAVDATVAALLLFAVLIIRPGASWLTCQQQTVPYAAQWLLFILGAGATLIAGGAALTLATSRWGWAVTGQRRLLVRGTLLAVLALGGGIVIGLWWARQSTGTLAAAEPRESWMGVVWLLAVMSLMAWQLDRQAERWAAGLALFAATAALFGLLALPDLQNWIGV